MIITRIVTERCNHIRCQVKTIPTLLPYDLFVQTRPSLSRAPHLIHPAVRTARRKRLVGPQQSIILEIEIGRSEAIGNGALP